MSPSSPENASPARQTLQIWMDAMQRRDVDTCLACCDDSDEFSVQLLPMTLGRPKMNKAMYSEAFRTGVAQLKPVTVHFDEVIDAGTVFTLRAASNGQSVSGTPWAFEYIFIVRLTEPKDGGAPKIVSMMEFVDSAEVQKFFVAEQKAKGAASKSTRIFPFFILGLHTYDEFTPL
ncbi:hypothetical protein K438DRAFT_1936843 [Mycena galopus ATCC 62051]|nr:hypothetical protein K438DRAFT_1936843 [Mycena galopus ATCC 62051]